MHIHTIENIVRQITGRRESLFSLDLAAHKDRLHTGLAGKSMLVIGGAGSIGSSFIRAALRFPLQKLVVVDVNENGLAELVRDIRSRIDIHAPADFRTYPINFGSPVFKRLFLKEGRFDVVANFAAHKHVRSEKDEFAIQAMFENNFVMAAALLELLQNNPPEHFFCVSTDKASNPVSIMGATKKLMEDVIFSFSNIIPITTARFANVLFSNGSLLESFINRYERNQPLVCPSDIRRFFVSPAEAGELCLLACILGNSGEIFIPKLDASTHLIPFKDTLEAFLAALGRKARICSSEEQARKEAAALQPADSESPYPVYFFESDTSGEKPYEEFFGPGDVVNNDLFHSLAVIQNSVDSSSRVQNALQEAQELLSTNTTKQNIVEFLERTVAGFQYLDRGKTLDQKM